MPNYHVINIPQCSPKINELSVVKSFGIRRGVGGQLRISRMRDVSQSSSKNGRQASAIRYIKKGENSLFSPFFNDSCRQFIFCLSHLRSRHRPHLPGSFDGDLPADLLRDLRLPLPFERPWHTSPLPVYGRNGSVLPEWI